MMGDEARPSVFGISCWVQRQNVSEAASEGVTMAEKLYCYARSRLDLAIVRVVRHLWSAFCLLL